MLHDIDTFISGINDYLAIHSPSTAPWTRNDVYALNALKGQFVGQGGGDEARRSEFLGGLEQRLGQVRGKSVFNDLRQFKNPDSPTTVDGTFHYGAIPDHAPGSAVLDPGSFHSTPAAAKRDLPKQAVAEPARASNTLMIDAKDSTTGHPLMVGGPQIGYFFPGFTYEIDMHAPGLVWRGATSAPFPGYMLIGRGEDFATTLTSSSGDIIDQYAETLCGGSDTQVPVQRPVQDHGHLQRRDLERRSGHVPHHRARSGDRLRDGQGPGGGDLLQALELRQGRARPALLPPPVNRAGGQPAVVLQRGVADAADVQLVLHRQQARRRVHERQAADPAQERRPRSADRGDRPVRVARAS